MPRALLRLAAQNLLLKKKENNKTKGKEKGKMNPLVLGWHAHDLILLWLSNPSRMEFAQVLPHLFSLMHLPFASHGENVETPRKSSARAQQVQNSDVPAPMTKWRCLHA